MRAKRPAVQLRLQAAGRRCGRRGSDAAPPGRGAALWRWGTAREAAPRGARPPHRKWRRVGADGGGGDDGGGGRGGRRRGRGGPLPLSLPRLPGRRAARGLRGLLLRGAQQRHADVSPASRAEPGARARRARQRADRWAGPRGGRAGAAGPAGAPTPAPASSRLAPGAPPAGEQPARGRSSPKEAWASFPSVAPS